MTQLAIATQIDSRPVEAVRQRRNSSNRNLFLRAARLPTSEPSGDIPSPASVLTVEEASRQLRISRWSLYKLINARKLKTFKIGHRRLITSDAVADLIKYLQEEGF